jgi:hypothetical protein
MTSNGIHIEVRNITPDGWVNMKALYDNGCSGKRRKVAWRLSWNVREERFARSYDFHIAETHGHRALLEAARTEASSAACAGQ